MREPGIGRRVWAIAEGSLASSARADDAETQGREIACILNAGDRDAHVRLTIYYPDREPVGPYLLDVPARRTRQVRYEELIIPRPIPRAIEYASVIESDVPIVVQHMRLDSREAENALISSVAFPA
jgi:hypothetical protein